jgi:hypothetical protein
MEKKGSSPAPPLSGVDPVLDRRSTETRNDPCLPIVRNGPAEVGAAGAIRVVVP